MLVPATAEVWAWLPQELMIFGPWVTTPLAGKCLRSSSTTAIVATRLTRPLSRLHEQSRLRQLSHTQRPTRLRLLRHALRYSPAHKHIRERQPTLEPQPFRRPVRPPAHSPLYSHSRPCQVTPIHQPIPVPQLPPSL